MQAGLADLPLRELLAVIAALARARCAVRLRRVRRLLPALATGAFAASFPLASYRVDERRGAAAAMDAWPRLLEELRILTSSLGRSIPQALFEVGRRAPEELRAGVRRRAPRVAAVHRLRPHACSVLKAQLADPTADAVCETLLVAHEVGGTDLDRRLEALIDDRVQDTQGRKDARARQAGARFARRFVLIVPAGMALGGHVGRHRPGRPTRRRWVSSSSWSPSAW